MFGAGLIVTEAEAIPSFTGTRILLSIVPSYDHDHPIIVAKEVHDLSSVKKSPQASAEINSLQSCPRMTFWGLFSW